MQFLRDTFTGTSGTDLNARTGEVGATWARHPASADPVVLTDANRCRANGAVPLYYASGIPGGADYDVEAVVRCISNDGLSVLGPALRLDTSAFTCYVALARCDAGGKYELFKVVAGTATSLATSAKTFVAGTDYTLKLTVRGSALNVYENGSLIIGPVTDSAVSAAGRAGLRGVSAVTNSAGLHGDTLTATDLVPEPAAYTPVLWQRQPRPAVEIVGY